MAKFIVDPNEFNKDFTFKSLFNVAADDLKAKADYETKELKLEEGKAQWKVPVTAVVVSKEGKERADTNVGIHVLNKVDIQAGVAYKVAGKVRVTPYIIEGGEGRRANQGLSVIADSLVPVKGDEPKG